MNRCSFSTPTSWMALLCMLPGAWRMSGGVQDNMDEFLKSVREALPSHSATPPVTDLAIAKASVASRAWEEKYQNMEGLIKRDITDISDDDSSAPGSLAITIKEGSRSLGALPARYSSVVIIGTVRSSASHVASNKHLVYSDYQLSVKKLLKGSTVEFGSEHSNIDVLLFGGGIRFPTNYIEYFVIQGVGFLEDGKDYLLFLWRSTKGMRAYDVLGAYLLEGQSVYPIVVGTPGAFSGAPLEKFESAVRSAIKSNVDR